MKISGLVQAGMGSIRLPGKRMKKIVGTSHRTYF
jgi:spore coat polysaccharide biosynthesis protein SpsF (cytidylyltransferase family)